jgi:hypothetical protein
MNEISLDRYLCMLGSGIPYDRLINVNEFYIPFIPAKWNQIQSTFIQTQSR